MKPFLYKVLNPGLSGFFILGYFFLCFSINTAAQFSGDNYDTDLLKPAFFKLRRSALRMKMKPNTVALLFAEPVKNRSNDVDYNYKQNADFYYLTGFNETNSVLVVFKEDKVVDGVPVNEILFVRDKNKFIERWSGSIMGVDSAAAKLDVACVKSIAEFEKFNFEFEKFREIFVLNDVSDFCYNKNEASGINSYKKIFSEKIEKSDGFLNVYDLKSMIASLREVKLPEEMALLKKAVEITCVGFTELIKSVEPGMTEYQGQAIVEYMFKKNGAECVGYPTIAGGAENGCVLHYTFNRRKLRQGDLYLVDAGAEYHGYTADVTRTIPVNGKFSNEQKLLYNIVLEAQKAGIKACMPGNDFRQPHKDALKVIENGLLDLGIIKDPKDAIKYFFHGTSHYLGLDVHDPGLFGKLVPGNVITVEPGIYIPAGSDCDPKWWNIGIRIEDDVLITYSIPEVLSKNLVKTVEEIEELMKQESLFNLIK